MRSRRFRLHDTPAGHAIADELGQTWAVVPMSVPEADGRAGELLAVARKVYALGLSDAYAGLQRGFHVRKGDDGQGGLTWDLMSVSKEVRRVGSVPRRRFRITADPLRTALEGLGQPVHAAALSDGRAEGADGRRGGGAGLAGFLAAG